MRRSIFYDATLMAMLSGPPALAKDGLPECEPETPPVSMETDRTLIELGRDLFYDPILSGNRTVACATCHHSTLGTSDGVALSIGDGGIGLGNARRVDPGNPPEQRIPRNAQALFNLGYAEFSVMFHDGRVERLDNGMIRTPLGEMADTGPLSVLAAQAMFPVLSPDEMAGHYSENEIAQAVRRGVLSGPDGAHQLLANRVSGIEDYRRRFDSLGEAAEPLAFGNISQALAAFMAHEWRADDSPFDHLICRGEPLPPDAQAGMDLFYGEAGCSTCHAGRFQTDHAFHAIAMPQIGPGKAERFEAHARDLGRQRVTGRTEDAYRFRTPSLRNVTLTAPYGHAGAYPTLETIIRHHLTPEAGLRAYDRRLARLPELTGAEDFRILDDATEVDAIAHANELAPAALSSDEIAALIAFLGALTDAKAAKGRLGAPDQVPSGLPVPNP